MNARKLMRGVAALSVLAALASPAAAQPIIRPGEVLTYFFAADDDPTNEHGIKDRSGNLHNGTDISFATEWALLPGHNPATGTFAAVMWGDDDTAGSGIYTHTKVKDLGIDKGPYTAMAWCMRGSTKGGDNMLFGTDNLNPFLHLGFRGDHLYFGHWLGGDVSADGVGADLLSWHHVAFRFNPAGEVKDIFYDGVNVKSGNPGPGPFGSPGQILMIGRYGNGASFAGLIEYVRVFNVALTDSQIADAAKDKF